jgi:hypothetical protein
MKRAGVIVVILLIAFLLFAAVRLHLRKPKIEIESVDWLTKRIKFKMSAGGTERAGTLTASDTVPMRSSGNAYLLDAMWSDMNIGLFTIRDRSDNIIKEVKVNFLFNRIERKEYGNTVPAWKTAFSK